MQDDERPRFAAFKDWGERRNPNAKPKKSNKKSGIQPAPAPQRAGHRAPSRTWAWLKRYSYDVVHDAAIRGGGYLLFLILTTVGGGAAYGLYQFDVFDITRYFPPIASLASNQAAYEDDIAQVLTWAPVVIKEPN